MELGLPIPEHCDLDRFIEIIEEELTFPAVILLDDIEFGLESAELDQRFWNTLRHLASSPAGRRIGFCITSRQAPAQLETYAAELGKPSPFFNTFETKKLHPFTPSEAQEFLACMAIERAEADWLIAQLGGWPVVLQEACKLRRDAHPQAQDAWRQGCLKLREKYAHLYAA